MLETLDYTTRSGSTTTILYFDLINLIVYLIDRRSYHNSS